MGFRLYRPKESFSKNSELMKLNLIIESNLPQRTYRAIFMNN